MPASEYQPQLATLVDEAPEGDQWLHEMKYDGYRIGCRIRNRAVALYSRNGKDWTARFPEVVNAAKELRVSDALIDGEVAMMLPDGRTSFQALQNALTGTDRAALAYFVFDLLRVSGESIERLPLEERKGRLLKLVGKPTEKSRIRYSEHVRGSGGEFFRQACRHGLEGIISKRRNLPHRPGRSMEWLKTKCILRQEFVIGGFTDPEGSRAGIGALLVGFYDSQGRLVFSGKVGTGFTHKAAVDLRARFDRLEQKTCPFATPPPGRLGRSAHWLRPELVGEVAFTEWTADGHLRHPSFQGLRLDKPAREVRREIAKSQPPKAEALRLAVARSGQAQRESRITNRKSQMASVVAGVRITHPDRVIYPDLGITKLELARFYESIGEWIVPHLRGRPLTLVRCPEGLASGCFFMKHSKVWAPDPLRRVRIKEKTKVGEYLIADTLAALVGLVQMGVLEIHTWNSVFETLERPNRLVLDLDPGDEVPWKLVVRAARTIRDSLSSLGLHSFVKTTGGKGLHIVAPLVPGADWSECLAFARAFAETIERTNPTTYTTEFAKAGRVRKILIDYLRNNRTNTSVAAYSTRAREHAPVSVPLAWNELTGSLRPQFFTVRTLHRRLTRLAADPWAGYWTSRQRLTKQMLKAVEAGPYHPQPRAARARSRRDQ